MAECFWENSRGLPSGRVVSKRSQSLSHTEKQTKISLATNMAFTAYIFQEDYDRLTRQELSHASQEQKGGSLFGQWTSTGNPVIHRAMPFGHIQASRDTAARELYEGFRVCYIGEWRPVQSHDYNERQARELLWGREPQARFLVLDVSRADIVPFLLNRQTAQQDKGRLEKLPGKNPFNKREVFEDPIPRRDYENPSRYALAAGQPNLPYQAPRASQFQEAYTTVTQWYSGDKGNKTLQKVLEDLKEVAVGNVDMSRDTRSQDISLSFVDKSSFRKKWEIRFPARFPAVGALLIENPGTHKEDQRRQGSSDKASKAVKNIISCIKTSSFMN